MAGNDMDSTFSLDDLLEDMGEKEALEKGYSVSYLSLDAITPYEFNRDITDEDCQDLVDQLTDTGWDLIQPIVVYPSGKELYTLIAGERRYRSFVIGGQKEIKAIVRDDLDPKRIREMNLDENLRRKDEDFPSLCKRLKSYVSDFNVSQKDAAKRYEFGLSTFNDMVKYHYRINDIPEIKKLWESEFKDKTVIKELIKLYLNNKSRCLELIEYALAHNCVNRAFLLKAIKDIDKDFAEHAEVSVASDVVSGANKDVVHEEQIDFVDNDGLAEQGQTEEQEQEQEQEQSDANKQSSPIVELLSDIPVSARKPSKAEIGVKIGDDFYFLELNYVPKDEGKILLRSITGEHRLVDKKECVIEYVM